MIKGEGDRFYVIDANGVIRGDVHSLEKAIEMIKNTSDIFDGSGSVKVTGVFSDFVYEVSEDTTSNELREAWKSYMGFI